MSADQLRGSMECVGWAWKKQTKTPLQKLALIMIADSIMGHTVTPDKKDLANWALDCCCNVAQLLEAIDGLLDAGFLSGTRSMFHLNLNDGDGS